MSKLNPIRVFDRGGHDSCTGSGGRSGRGEMVKSKRLEVWKQFTSDQTGAEKKVHN